LTEEDKDLIARGDRDTFDGEVAKVMETLPPSLQQTLLWRRRPYCTESLFDVLKSLEEYNLKKVASQIECPMFIAAPEDEQFWPGQSQALAEALNSPSHLAAFTRAEGANWHCEPLARARYDQKLFDWLDDVLINQSK
jgi:hypothetical protein